MTTRATASNTYIAEVRDKWVDVLACAEPDDYTERNLITEFLEDIAWLEQK